MSSEGRTILLKMRLVGKRVNRFCCSLGACRLPQEFLGALCQTRLFESYLAALLCQRRHWHNRCSAVVNKSCIEKLCCRPETLNPMTQVFHMIGGPADMFAPGLVLRAMRYWVGAQLRQRLGGGGGGGGDGGGAGSSNGSGPARPEVVRA